ncbi:nitric oxide synthase oxygenase [Nonomuraea sp. NPDC050394]|uniref:nitric oxide synthase oxygenase n=1 Tax=Nonomuraea sp. NPDC050394 TaxID=3364363 RepID=UPI00378A477D
MQTVEDLAEGCRVGWRNHARCVGRLHWQSLRVLDRRDARTAEDVARSCAEHLRYATNGGNIRNVMTVFPPTGVRIWNPQLIRYAGYRQPDGSVVGDPLNADLTAIAQRLGWQGRGGRFDVLPLVIEMPGQEPEMFELPSDAVLEVEITHPDLPWFAELGLRWHAVPAISNMAFELDGITYTAAPFNGWYVGCEIGARNFGDVGRYDMLPAVAERMGLDTRTSAGLWKDRALIELNQAVLHSYRAAGVRIVDHHVAARQFVTHEERESDAGRSTPADWAWIVPPLSASTTPTFHRSYSAQPGLSPDFHYQPDPWKSAARCPVAGPLQAA